MKVDATNKTELY